jgi:acyl dehydratase
VGDGRLTRFGVRFSRQVWPGDTLTTTASVDALREEDGVHLADLSVVTTNQDGVEVVSGYATAHIDG